MFEENVKEWDEDRKHLVLLSYEYEYLHDLFALDNLLEKSHYEVDFVHFFVLEFVRNDIFDDEQFLVFVLEMFIKPCVLCI